MHNAQRSCELSEVIVIAPGLRMVLATGLLMLAACQAERQTATAAREPSESTANTRQLMLGLVEPASNAVFRAQAEAPADDAGWERVEANALVLAEAGVLLTTGSRRIEEQQWLEQARALVDAGKAAAAAARARDADQMSAAGDAVYATCEECHAKYLPPVAAE
jgi:hypothetical protein